MMFKSLTFGDINSKDLDMYISGSSAYDAPPRAFEMIDVPGRNGQLSIDGGRYENIEVTYPAGVFAESEEAFRAKMASIRAAFLSQVGYQRLTDEYNPDEYRLGIFSGGIEADPVARLKASEFDITFNCKPQRFLTSGEEPVPIGEYTDPVGEDTAPYLFRRSPQFADTYDTCIPTIVGGSVVGNQLVESTGSGLSVTVPNGHKYYSAISGTKTIGASTGTAITGLSGGVDMVIDLTAMLGTSIADRAYAKEQAQTGSGIAWLKSYGFISDSYEAYDTGSIKSVEATEHVTRGFNAWDEVWEVGGISTATGGNTTTSGFYRSKNYAPILQNTRYYFKFPVSMAVLFYDAQKNFMYATTLQNETFVTPVGAHYLRFRNATANTWTPYNNDICINISDPSRNGEYEAYTEHSYPLGNVTLRGVPKVDANDNIYYDGDTYPAYGTATRKYGIVDLGTLTWSVLSDSPYGNFTTTALNQLAKQDPTKPTYICNAYDEVAFNTASSTADKYIWLNNNKTLIVKDTSKASMTVADFKTAMSGVYLVYELATPTTETADPFTSPMLCDPSGTEEWVTSNGVPVGQVTEYGPDPTKLHNPTLFASKPLIKVTGTGTLGVGSYSMTITGTASQQLYIDCDLMEAWEDVGGARVPRNDRITYAGNKFPELDPGETGITADGITAVEIVPRWWTL